MIVQPLQDRVLVKRKQGDEKVGLIFIPEVAREKMGEGEVMQVGPGRPRLPVVLDVSKLDLEEVPTLLATMREALSGGPIPLTVKPGDTVLFSAMAGTPLELTVNGKSEQYVMLREDDILAVVQGLAPGESADVTVHPPTPRE
jgi:co-chaperonin GroES (HSP10)